MRKTFALLAATALTHSAFSVPGDKAAVFLSLPQGARPVAMGEAYTAISGDIYSAHWNPAGMADLGGWVATASFTPTYLDMYYGYLAGAKAWRRTALGLAVSHFNYGELEGLDEHARNPNIFTASDLAVSLGFAYRLQRQKLQLGASARYLSQRIENESAGTVMLDLGAVKKFRQLTLGAAARNLGPGLKFVNETSGLPITFGLGATYYFPNLPLTPALAVEVPMDDALALALGAEYSFARYLSLRAGIKTDRDAGFVSWLRAGFGIRYQALCVDYAVIPSRDIGYTHTVSLGYKK
ncbi:MAG TPA: hypothetical protein DDW31_00590 [candidate division Zixibacteria bacterium]|jgi:hypothetical protein|nr:hypothetical protein [candidate division Zixibacteria bacterium]